MTASGFAFAREHRKAHLPGGIRVDAAIRVLEELRAEVPSARPRRVEGVATRSRWPRQPFAPRLSRPVAVVSPGTAEGPAKETSYDQDR
jgi:hypothetical protein